MWPPTSGAHDGDMFSHPFTNDVLRRQHGDRLMDAAVRHRRIFGRRRDDVAPITSLVTPLAPVVALPARVDRTSPRDSRVA